MQTGRPGDRDRPRPRVRPDELKAAYAGDIRQVWHQHGAVRDQHRAGGVPFDVVDAAVETLGLSEVLQVASFHPHYQFADTDADDIGNYTNRAPYPTLHLLRHDSVERAVAAVPDPAAIFETNIETLRRLGHVGWRRLMSDEGGT